MGFLGYLLLGVVAYGAGWATRIYVLGDGTDRTESINGKAITLTHPMVVACLAGCFAIMLVVSYCLGQWVLHHNPIDWTFVVVNSIVATFVYGFALLPELSGGNGMMPD